MGLGNLDDLCIPEPDHYLVPPKFKPCISSCLWNFEDTEKYYVSLTVQFGEYLKVNYVIKLFFTIISSLLMYNE